MHDRVGNPPVLPSSLDALVAVLIQISKVLPHFLLPRVDHVALFDVLEPELQSPYSLDVKLVLMRLEVS